MNLSWDYDYETMINLFRIGANAEQIYHSQRESTEKKFS